MVTIERLDESGWGTLRELRLAALRDAPDVFWATWEDEARFTRREWVRFARDVVWFVAVRDEPLGLVGCLRRPEVPDEAEVIGMWVRAAERGTGIADLLLEALHGWAEADGVRCLGLWVVVGNERARRFYDRHRYRSTGELAPLPPGRPGQEQRMRRRCATSGPEILQSSVGE